MRKAAMFLLIGVCGVASAAGVYTWTDENGKVHYSDQPGNAAAREIILPATPAPDQGQRERLQKQQKLLEVYETERKEKHEQEAKRKFEQQQLEQQCAAARMRLKHYEQAGELTVQDDDGKARTLSKAEYRQVLEDAREALAHGCDGG